MQFHSSGLQRDFNPIESSILMYCIYVQPLLTPNSSLHLCMSFQGIDHFGHKTLNIIIYHQWSEQRLTARLYVSYYWTLQYRAQAPGKVILEILLCGRKLFSCTRLTMPATFVSASLNNYFCFINDNFYWSTMIKKIYF